MSRTETGYSLVYQHPSGGKLYQGSEEDALGAIWAARSPNPDARPFKVDLLVLAAEEVQPRSRALSILSVPLQDRLFRSVSDGLMFEALAGRAAKVVARDVSLGRRVLVTCAAGLNRSSLVSALALRRLGVSGPSAVRKIRRARGPSALGNRSFLERAAQIAPRASSSEP